MNARKKRIFWATLAATGSLAASARAAEVTAAEAARLKREAPPKDAEDSEAALDQAIAALESEAVRRALEGVEIPVFHQGHECGNTVKHSDQLLMFLLKALKPERYAGGRESAPPQRPVVLDIDLSAAEDDAQSDDGV